MFKDFLLRKMFAAKLKDVPPEQQEKLLNAIQSDPEFFKQVATEIQQKMKEGKDQMAAVTEVIQKHQDKLKTLMG